MPYLGRPVTNAGQFEIIDDISSGFDGSETSFTLQVGGTDIQPDAANVTIVLDGVVQIPSSAYAVTASTLNFSEAPTSGTEFHGVLAGQSQFIESDFIVDSMIKSTANISGSKINTDFSAQTVKADIFDGMVSGSAQLADDISGSFSKEHLGAKVANVVTSSAQLAADISGSFGNQRVGTSDSPTFAGGTVTGDFAVGGTLTAQEVHTEFESASILFTSGSTKFGDSGDDLHNMTGSIRVSGSLANESFFLGHNVGIGTNNPAFDLHIGDNSNSIFGANLGSDGLLIAPVANNVRLIIEGDADASITLVDDGASSNLQAMMLQTDGGFTKFRSLNDDTGGHEDNIIVMNHDNGNVGIGTNNPTETLFVNGVTLSTTGYIAQHDTSYYRLSSANGTERARFILDGSDLQVKMGGSEKVRIDSSGNVGIGTATPVSGGLHIHTDASTEGIYLKSEGDTRNNLVFDSNISSAADNIAFIDANWNETNVARISMFTGTDTSNKDDGRIGFATAAAGTVAERMRIETDGSVGIHTTSPNVGSYTSERGVLTIGSTDNGSANNYANLELQGHAIANNVTIGDISWYDHTNYNAIVRGGRDSSTTTGFLAFFTNGGSGVSERMRIDKDGHVEINDGNLVIGTSGHGIDFSATSNATGMSSELLDDYEEGVYDITIGGLGGGSIGLHSSKQALSYTKIGRQVTVQGEISVTSVSSLSGTMTINLPFSVGSTIGDLSSRAVGSFSSQNHNFNDFGLTIHSHTYEGQSVMYFVYHKDNAGWEYVNTNTLAYNTEFRVSLTYFTN